MRLFVDSNYLSPYAMSVFVALREKGIPFEVAPLNLQAGEHLSVPYANELSTLRVPSISVGEFHLSESSAICEYLEDSNSEIAIYPRAPELKAKARELQAWLRSDLMPLRNERPTEVVFLKCAPPPLSNEAQNAAQKLFNVAERYLFGESQYLFGSWSIADTELSLMLNRLVFSGDPVPTRLERFSRYQWQRPSVQEWCRIQRPAQCN